MTKAHRNSFIPFHFKLTAAFLLTSLLPILLSVVIVLSIMSSYVERDVEDRMILDISTKTQQMENYFSQLYQVQSSLSSLIPVYLNNENAIPVKSSATLHLYQVLQYNIRDLQYTYGINSIQLYSNNFPFFSENTTNMFPLDKIPDPITEALKAGKYDFMRLNELPVVPSQASRTITFYGFTMDLKGNLTTLHTMLIDLPLNLRQILGSAYDSIRFSIITEDGTVLYSNTKENIPRIVPEKHALDTIVTDDQNCRSVLKKSQYTLWYYYFEEDNDPSILVNNALTAGYLIVFAVALLLCLLAIIFFPRALSKRIKRFSSAIDNMSDAEIASEEAADSILHILEKESRPRDEIDSIILSFSGLLRKNKALNEAVKEHELQIEKSKFDILREQINPHFLYNTLDTIRTCMLMEQPQNACRAVESLSRLDLPEPRQGYDHH